MKIYYHKELHLGCCSSPRSAFKYEAILTKELINVHENPCISNALKYHTEILS